MYFLQQLLTLAKLLVVNTTVSSKMLKAIAEKEGLRYEETLTGFKWIGNKAQDLIEEGYTCLFAYEEAIGFMIGNTCFDKDGVSAAAVFIEMANLLHANGTSCFDQLTSLYEKYGYFISQNSYFFCYEPPIMEKIFEEIANDGNYPTTCGEYKITVKSSIVLILGYP